ncbi:DUF1501 domain-containing protein [Thalassotalea sp. HSM 43]|uniref:DUF1501 domain-containing protein n=1 Tax=Thalassotalea sp. HSM 43 TaxID=2552945 RepID=UPI0010815BD2|nr:DUF1501 domain-containing protein [Thalassotalea sp. HSM 43]QBY04249.1 DUF1501 domain-containing protein [Thalassotalea sp. HSM 43]
MPDNNNKSRRQFLKQISALSASMAGASATGWSQLVQASTLSAEQQDFKALVYVFLAGGNDSFNTLIPHGDSALRRNYEHGRRSIAIANEQLHPLQLQDTANVYNDTEYQGFGLHPSCGDLATLFNQQEMAFVCNLGNLVEPTSRDAILDKTANLPPQLYSHSDQQLQFQSEPVKPFRHGWGGRMAELLQDYNQSTNISPLISLSGLNSFQVTRNGQPSTYAMNHNGAIALTKYTGNRKWLVNQNYQHVDESSHLMMQKYRDIFSSAQQAEVIVNSTFTSAAQNGVDYDDIFSSAGANDSKIGQSLKTIAKMLAGRQAQTNNRPVYFVEMGGFDTHQNILINHQALLKELNDALHAFRNALVAQGDFDNTLTFIGSEFGRTLTPNGNDEGTGTDHAWGGHAMVLGGMVDGGKLYGSHPDLMLRQGLDASDGRGRWIPTTATTQVNAIMANWLGVEKIALPSLFPSINNFSDPFASAANLAFLK